MASPPKPEGRNKRGGDGHVAKITEVAREAGVSIATVSRVMNRPHMVSDSTRERVESAIRSLDYQPNRVASSLRSGLFRTVALLMGDVSQPWYAELMKALEAEFDQWGYAAYLYDLDHDADRLIRYVEKGPQLGVAGIIVSTGDRLDHPELSEVMALTHESVPIVLAGQRLRDVPIPAIVYDDSGGARAASEHLLEMGAAPVAFLGYLPDSFLMEERYRGFAEGVESHGQEAQAWAWPTRGRDYVHGYQTTREMLRAGRVPGGILAANDQLALGAMRAIHEHGIEVPQDVGVVGFGDLEMARYLRPSLSSVQGPVQSIAKQSCQALMAILHGESPPPVQIVERSLVVRESSARRAEH